MLVPTESSSAVLVMISSKSVSICNHSRAILVDSSRNRTFLSHLALNPYRVVTDGQTDRQTDRIPIANTRSQQYLPVQLSRVKIS